MATLYERYITGDDGGDYAQGARWLAQTFTPAIAHKITSVKLKLYRLGLPGEITVSIQGVDGSDHPDNSDICSGTTTGNDLTEDTGGEWREITLGAGFNLAADTKYAIVAKAPDGGGANALYWRKDATEATYAGGCVEVTNDSGSNWVSSTTHDYMFEDWGEPAAVTHEGSATLSGVGTLSAIGRMIFAGKATLSGVGTLTALGGFLRTASATLSGIGTLTARGGLLLAGKATLSGVGTLVAKATMTYARILKIIKSPLSTGLTIESSLSTGLTISSELSTGMTIESKLSTGMTISSELSTGLDITSELKGG